MIAAGFNAKAQGRKGGMGLELGRIICSAHTFADVRLPPHAATPSHAPRLGEHNRRIFGELLVMDAAPVAALEADGVSGSAPEA